MESVNTRKQRIMNAAQKHRGDPLVSLHHHMDLNWLHEAFRRVRKDASPGVDGQTVSGYSDGLTGKLKELMERAKGGRYKPPPVKRAWVPKNQNEDRPIGLPTVEDKILQRAVAMILEPVYEQDFLPFSYGFRPGRSTHQALSYLHQQCYEQKVQWILEVDLRKYFDTVGHRQMLELLGRRVRDGVITRLVGRWLKAGVWEKGEVSYPDEGTPQGGVISPLLSNIYLHEVLDKWFVESVLPRCGRCFIVRFADDFVMGFECLEDAEKVRRVIGKRLGKYGLEINEGKTRMVRFGRPVQGGENPGTFDFLGFTHYWGKSRRGYNVVLKKTSSSRFRRALKNIKEWGYKNNHLPLAEQQRKLNEKLRGHDAYYGVTGNYRMLSQLREEVAKLWYKWLRRRNRGKSGNWEKFQARLRTFPLQPPRIVHSTQQ
jgi:RNA-directed DNA polymerase